MPKGKRGKPIKVDASVFFSNSKAQLATAPKQRDEHDDGSSRFPDRNRNKNQELSGGFGEARGDGDDNWRGNKVQQPPRDDRSRPSRDINPDEANDWRGGVRAQPLQQRRRGDQYDDRDRDPNVPAAGRADMEDSWGRGTAKQPAFEFRGGPTRGDEGGPMQGRADAEELWGRGTQKQPVLEFRKNAIDESNWERGTVSQPSFEMRGPPQSTAEAAGWLRGQKPTPHAATNDNERPAHLQLKSKLKKVEVEETAAPVKKNKHNNKWGDEEEEEEEEEDDGEEEETDVGGTFQTATRSRRGVSRRTKNEATQQQKPLPKAASHSRFDALREETPPRAPVKRIVEPKANESSRFANLSRDDSNSNGKFFSGDRDQGRINRGFANFGRDQGRNGRFGGDRGNDQGRFGGYRDQERSNRGSTNFGRDQERSGGFGDDRGNDQGRFGGYRGQERSNRGSTNFGRDQERSGGFGGYRDQERSNRGSTNFGRDQERSGGFGDDRGSDQGRFGGYRDQGRGGRFGRSGGFGGDRDGNGGDRFGGDRFGSDRDQRRFGGNRDQGRDDRRDRGFGDQGKFGRNQERDGYDGSDRRRYNDDYQRDGEIGRPRINIKRRTSNASSDSNKSSQGGSPVKQEKEPTREVVKHHYVRTLEEFITNPGSPTKAEAVDILLAKSIPKKYLSELVVWAVSFAADKNHKIQRLVAELLVEMRRSKSNPVMQSNDMVLGFEMSVKRLPGLLKDAPSADMVLKLISKHCHEAGCWPKDETDLMSKELIKLMGLVQKVEAVEESLVVADLTDSEKLSLATKLLNAAKGAELIQHYEDNKDDYQRLNEVDIYAAVLQKSAPLDAECLWATEDQFGPFLEHLLSEKGGDVHMPVIAETARVLNELGFPKDASKKFSHLSEAIFCALYNNDILPEEAFIFWSEDNDTDHEGKMKLMIQTTKWLNWLKTPDEDESSEDEDDE